MSQQRVIFEFEKSLGEEINKAAIDMNEGYSNGRWRIPCDSAKYPVTMLQLPDGRTAQAQLIITADEDDFIEVENLPEREVQ